MNTKIEYEVGKEDILRLIEKTLYGLYKDKVTFNGPDPKRYVVITTGIAGLYQISKLVKEKYKIDFVLNTEGYISFTMPFLANVKFILDKEFDSNLVGSNMIKGFMKTSYNYIITEEGENTIELIATGEKENNNEKYYWINYLFCNTKTGVIKTIDSCIPEHPFCCTNVLRQESERDGTIISLLNWKEITKEEFESYFKMLKLVDKKTKIGMKYYKKLILKQGAQEGVVSTACSCMCDYPAICIDDYRTGRGVELIKEIDLKNWEEITEEDYYRIKSLLKNA